MPARPLALATGQPATPRRGAASLVVVMILFFVITLVAAYTSRNLLFEQRTSANAYRATLAFESAEAGIEWALARLNEGRMNDDCTVATTLTSPPQPSFRERYLAISATTGVITAASGAGGAEKLAGCVYNGTAWACHCPDSGEPTPTTTFTGNGPFPAFWVKFRNNQLGSPQRPGVIRIQVNGCTRADPTCLSFNVTGVAASSPAHEANSGDGLATVWSMFALRSALPTAPAAALTVRGTFATTANPKVTNTDTTSGGFTIQGSETTGAFSTAGITLDTIPGTPPAASVVQNDSALTLGNLTITPATPANTGENRMFNSVFGTWPTTYFAQPALATVNCASDCTAADVNALVQRRPGQPVRVTGGGRLRIDAAIGTAAAPVLIISDGTIEFDSTAATFFGVAYSSASDWRLRGGDGFIRGAAIAERNFRFDGDNPSIIYDRDVILALQNANGSFTKVPGSWRDYQWGINP